MAVDLSPIDESLLATIANLHGMPNGAFNIRRNGKLVERHSSANIEISTKDDEPGIDIRIKDGTRGETCYIPVIVTAADVHDVVYNTFYVGEDCDVTIVAGCGIHNECNEQSEHDGIVRPENAAWLKTIFPQAAVTTVPGTEHALPIFIPEQIDDAVDACLAVAQKG